MPLLSLADLELTEQEVVHCFAVLALRAKRDYGKHQLHFLKCSVAYISMATLCLKLSLGSAVVLLVLALTLLVACLIKESENLRSIQSQLFDLVQSTPLEQSN